MYRIGDVVIAFILIAFTLPLMSIVALAIKLDSPGPIFFRLERLGRDGRRVRILKFRTTVCRPHDPRRSGISDAHLTRVGWFLRRTHVDGLPQLMNVLNGELTLMGVGPSRPFGSR
jgi:lipopolysaccharide/colanic/teichoic acid biosynthesis glycosyltransferase